MSATNRFRGKILMVLGRLIVVVIGIAAGTVASSLAIELSSGSPVLVCAMVPFLLIGSGWLLLVKRGTNPEHHKWTRALGLSVWGGMLLSLVIFGLMIFPSFDTRYAPAYSEEAFQSIQRGDTKQEVLQRLGEPLRVLGANGEVLSYSDSPSGSNYLMRDIVLDADGRVSEIRREIYWD